MKGYNEDESTCSHETSTQYFDWWSYTFPTDTEILRACDVPACWRYLADVKALNPTECILKMNIPGNESFLLYHDCEELFQSVCGSAPGSSSASTSSSAASTSGSGSSSQPTVSPRVERTSATPTASVPETTDPTIIVQDAVTDVSTSSPDTVLIASAVGGVVALALLVVLWVRWTRRRSMERDKLDGIDDSPVAGLGGPLTGPTTVSSYMNQASSKSIAVRQLPDHHSGATSNSDEKLLARERILVDHRIDASAIHTKEFLGKGGHGVVFLVQIEAMSTPLASKRLNPSHATAQQLQRLIAEVKVVATLQHASIVDFVGVAWTSNLNLQVLFEYMAQGDLRSYLHASAAPSDSNNSEGIGETDNSWPHTKLRMALQIIEALAYTHSFNPPLIHRDLKSHNVLLSDTLQAKISDFGVARLQSDAGTMTTGIGTSRWMAPEVINGGGDYSESSDIYSFGVILTELDTHAMPYEQGTGTVSGDGGTTMVSMGAMASELSMMQRVGRGEMRPSVSRSCPPKIATLARECLAFDPSSRPNALEIAYRLRQLSKE